MFLPEINKINHLNGDSPGKPRFLVAPLDWGLGHATRCIPIIRELLAQGAEVILAGEGMQEQLLKTEFPDLLFLSLPGYRIRYAKTKKGLAWKMILQGPKIKRAIRHENEWLKKIVAEHPIDAVISDNRYGLHHPGIPCIFMTHQLLIKSWLGKWSEKILQKRNYKYINQFTECWVPDNENGNDLAGELSHPVLKPAVPLCYTGPLSRFEKKGTAEKKGHILIILSGPEPQRSLLEEKMINGIANYNGTATIVRGVPGSASLVPSTNMIQVFNHLPAEELNKEMEKAEWVIGRSGYSTVMDIAALQKKSILIPTPGQTEQEYLGAYLMKRGIAVSIDQQNFSLKSSLEIANGFNYQFPDLMKTDGLKKTIAQLLHQSVRPALG